MIFNLNDFLRAIADSLDVIEVEIFGISTNHSKRIAYMSVLIAKQLKLTNKEIFDLASLAILHDNGASLKILHDNLVGNTKEKLSTLESRKEHCLIGEENLETFPFLTAPKNIIKYHHEKYNGSGFFGLKSIQIPVFSQIIALSDHVDLTYDLRKANPTEIIKSIRINANVLFSRRLVNIFSKIAEESGFWFALQKDNIDNYLEGEVPKFDNDVSITGIRQMTKTFSKIIDAKSAYTQRHSLGLSEAAFKMAKFYNKSEEETMKLMIATDLHDLGKLGISNMILDKTGKLTDEEFKIIKKHPQITKRCLEKIKGFEDITQWAANHHERLDGSGYPCGLRGKDLDFNSRLVSILDIYQALREERPYRSNMNHNSAIEILKNMAVLGQIDADIVLDVDEVFDGEKELRL